MEFILLILFELACMFLIGTPVGVPSEPHVEYNTGIYKNIRSMDDPRQEYIQFAYDVGGFEDVLLYECENGLREINTKGDSGSAIGLCQMNSSYHKIPALYYTDWKFQIQFCHEKRQGGTKFYGPDRIMQGEKCYIFSQKLFTFYNRNDVITDGYSKK